MPIFAHAYTPTAPLSSYGIFVSGSGYELPSTYFDKVTLSKYEGGSDNYVLRTTPNNSSGGTHIKYTSAWQSSNLYVYANKNSSWYNEFNSGYPSLTEPTISRGQCVAFAKAMTNTGTTGTASWKASDYVIPQVSQWYLNDISSQHAGKMVAYFGNSVPTGTRYPQPQDGPLPGHVGIFLKYAYIQQKIVGTTNLYRYQIIGFWIADENYEGTPATTNPDGKIRKHLILINPVANANGVTKPHTYAGQYRFVNI